MFGFRAAEIDKPDRNAPADQPADDAVQDDPVGAVGEGRTRAAGVAELDLGQTVADDEPSPGVVEHDIEEAQRPAERLTQRRRMQDRVAEQREAAATHRPCAHAEEFIVELGGDRQPERAIGLRRNRLIDRGCQADAGKDRRRRLAEPPQAVSASSTKPGAIMRRSISAILSSLWQNWPK